MKRNIYYVPGSISLILLAPLLYISLQNLRNSRRSYALEIIMFDPAEILKDTTYTREFSTYPPNRDFLTFELTGNSITDRIKLDHAQLRIREIETAADQVHGVNFHFTDSAKYGSFVRAIDILNRENASRFLACAKDIWFIGPSLEAKRNDMPAPICGTSSLRHCIPLPMPDPDESIWSPLKSKWPILVFFLALMLCATRSLLARRPSTHKLMGMLPKMRRR